ncbi:hypothetical protein RvY_18754 [Ramazzottius varieornatus]|uniref:DEP domain-containing protein n=1 Tax=Ramazzottius varieornatus TaxID=947166 RepID=A0A1D1W6X0_RAMVA|nr:hypothetical protein RvY_18754 [Ramazzottius varieornatus]
MEKIQHGSPFRATRLWNMVATDFTTNMPIRNHRKKLQKYDNCFMASDAVDWMEEYLKRNPNFSDRSTREIAVKMLDRLYQHQAFEAVGKEACSNGSLSFKSDSTLYRFSARADKAIRPLSSYNGHNTKPASSFSAENSLEKKVTAEDVWLNEFFTDLAKLLRLDSAADIVASIDVNHVIANTLNSSQSSHNKKEAIPDFVRSAIDALERWPDTPKGVPCTPGFERCLLHVVEAWLRGLEKPLISLPVAELLKKSFELLMPSSEKRDSMAVDSSSSVESFMLDILKGANRRCSFPDVCLETAFAGTIPETRLVRKRPRSSSLFPNMENAGLALNGSMSGECRSESADCIMKKTEVCERCGSFSSATSTVHRSSFPGAVVLDGVGDSVSLEKLNPGYRDDSYGEVESGDQYFTPIGKGLPEIDWSGFQLPISPSCPELVRSIQLILLAENPKNLGQLDVLLSMFEQIFKSNQLHFSENLTTQDFVTHCFAPIILEEVGAALGVRLLSFMILHRAEISQPVEGFRAKVEMIMKTHGIEAAFCKRITTSEYQAQKNAHLHQHMTQLLNNIVTDTVMDLKEKRKRLLLFQKSYPDVYADRFTNSTSEESILAACVTENKPKPRLAMFKSLRSAARDSFHIARGLSLTGHPVE